MAWLRRIGEAAVKLRWVRVTTDALHQYGQHHCFYMSAAISFYSIIAIAPLTYIAFRVLSYILGSSTDAQQQVQQLLSTYLLPDAASSIVKSLASLQYSVAGSLAAWVALGALLWSSVSFYEALMAIFNLAWGGAARRFLHRKARALGAFALAGMFVFLTMVLTGAVAAVSAGAAPAEVAYLNPILLYLAWVMPYVLSVLVFFISYKYMPNAFVPWNVALGVALPVGVLFELGKRLFASATIILSFQKSFYGPVAWFVALMVWIYWSSNIVLLGAEFGAAVQRQQEEFFPETG